MVDLSLVPSATHGFEYQEANIIDLVLTTLNEILMQKHLDLILISSRITYVIFKSCINVFINEKKIMSSLIKFGSDYLRWLTNEQNQRWFNPFVILGQKKIT